MPHSGTTAEAPASRPGKTNTRHPTRSVGCPSLLPQASAIGGPGSAGPPPTAHPVGLRPRAGPPSSAPGNVTSPPKTHPLPLPAKNCQELGLQTEVMTPDNTPLTRQLTPTKLAELDAPTDIRRRIRLDRGSVSGTPSRRAEPYHVVTVVHKAKSLPASRSRVVSRTRGRGAGT